MYDVQHICTLQAQYYSTSVGSGAKSICGAGGTLLLRFIWSRIIWNSSRQNVSRDPNIIKCYNNPLRLHRWLMHISCSFCSGNPSSILSFHMKLITSVFRPFSALN